MDPRVLQADPSTLTPTWKVIEHLGTEVYKPNETDVPLTSKDDLKPGDKFWVPGLIGGYHEMTVVLDENGEFYGDDGKFMTALEFAQDDRKCWITVGLINKRGLEKLLTEDSEVT